MSDIPVKRIIPSSLTVISLILLTAAIAGGGVYFWREQYITDLKDQISNSSQNDIVNENEEQQPDDTTENTAPEGYPIVFVPEGRLTAREKQTLTEKLIAPLFDYYQDVNNTSSEMDIISMMVEKETDANYYIVNIVTKIKSTNTFGYMGFLFGSTRNDYKYWTPECFESECTFSDEYKGNHPEVVETYEECPNCSLEIDL